MHNKSFFDKVGLKENLFIVMIFGIPGLSIFISNLLNRDKQKSVGDLLCFTSFLLLGLSLCGIVCNIFPLTSRLLVCLSLSTLTICIDYLSGKVWNNTFFHLVNTGYFGFAGYLWFMSNYPDSFPKLWQTISSSALEAFDMIILCQVFQIVGYYLIWKFLYPVNKSIESWSKSPRNLFNLSFLGSHSIETTIFTVLVSLGLVYRLWNLSLGRVYYTEGSGIPFLISILWICIVFRSSKKSIGYDTARIAIAIFTNLFFLESVGIRVCLSIIEWF
jgi:hypothetical protein